MSLTPEQIEALSEAEAYWRSLLPPAPQTPEDTTTVALLPCPFCGSTVTRKGSQTIGHGSSVSTIMCGRCGVEMPEGYGDGLSAEQKWNLRAYSEGR